MFKSNKIISIVIGVVVGIALLIGVSAISYNNGYANGHDDGVDAVWHTVMDCEDGTDLAGYDSDGNWKEITILYR